MKGSKSDRDDGLFYPRDRDSAWRHIALFILDVNEEFELEYPDEISDFKFALHRFARNDITVEEFVESGLPVVEFLASDPSRRFSWHPNHIPYICAEITLKMDNSIEMGEVDVALEAYISLAKNLCPNGDARPLFRKYFWPK